MYDTHTIIQSEPTMYLYIRTSNANARCAVPPVVGVVRGVAGPGWGADVQLSVVPALFPCCAVCPACVRHSARPLIASRRPRVLRARRSDSEVAGRFLINPICK